MFNWSVLPDEELLKVRIKDFYLHIENSILEQRIQKLYSELKNKNVSFLPPCYLADEWLCPNKMPIIGIPFYLAHPRLIQLEQKMMLEVEGGNETWCMKLLRHETGHAINYAYKLYQKTRWRKLFGKFSEKYTFSSYTFFPYSRRYVLHLEDHYAQSHPDEDFAETFAVWLNPSSNWQKKYKGWPALKKLQYVDHLINSLCGTPPLITSNEKPWAASRMRSTLFDYYQRKRKLLGEDFSGFYDPALKKIFSTKPNQENCQKAFQFLSKNRKLTTYYISKWAGERKFDVDKLLRKLTMRSKAMNLYLHKGESETLCELIAFVSAVMNKIHHFEKQ
ncbi:hypothetical protein BVX93_00265 [bacterium B13(2017)]|nr:hypothetical protein BVX93_00265 [bacterium B13(2017)]